MDLGAGKGHVYKHVNTYTTSHVTECDTAKECLDLPRQDIQVVSSVRVSLSPYRYLQIMIDFICLL